MAIQDDERTEIIAAINGQPESVRKLAAKAFLLGHEEGWWLARTDPESGVSPVVHATDVNPFTKTVKRPGYVIVTIAYNRPGRLPGASAKLIPVPVAGETVPVEFYVDGGNTVIGYTLDLWSNENKDEPLFHQEKTVPAVCFQSTGTYTVLVGELLVS